MPSTISRKGFHPPHSPLHVPGLLEQLAVPPGEVRNGVLLHVVGRPLQVHPVLRRYVLVHARRLVEGVQRRPPRQREQHVLNAVATGCGFFLSHVLQRKEI